jgi:hypothetical protein
MVHQPTALGFEAKETTLVHEQEEHDQSLLFIDKGMPPVGTGCVMVPKALKEGKQQVDIVSKGWGDHGGFSWKVLSVFSKTNQPPPIMSMHLCTPLILDLSRDSHPAQPMDFAMLLL